MKFEKPIDILESIWYNDYTIKKGVHTMTNIEKALEIGTGLETSVEELDATLVRGDIGMNDITGIEPADEDIEAMHEQFQYESCVQAYGHNAKYFY